MEKREIQRIYGRYASFYDAVFSRLFTPRIKRGIEGIGIRKGDRIIEVGVGTGLSLPHYPRDCTVVGIDITRKMLEKAGDKRKVLGLRHVELVQMDAENMTFPDDSFDHAVLPFVVSVVGNPERMMAEVKRITRKNGKIVVINHFCSRHRFLQGMERLFSPLFSKLGWKAAVPIELLSNHCSLNITDISRTRNFDPYLVVHAVNTK